LLDSSTEFIELLKKGDRIAFAQLVEEYQHIVYNTILNICKQQHDAEDLTQEVFMQIFKSVHQFRGEAKLSTWIYKITYTKALEWERKKKAKRSINYFKNLIGIDHKSDGIADFNHPGIELQNKENATLLYTALDQLSDNQRIAFILIKAEGLTYQEVGKIMNKTTKSIEGLIHRANHHLRQILEKRID